jgi:3-oxo-5alpha-steroid 4-dehydrogenase
VSVEIPAPVPADTVPEWSDEVDVLVLGAGMAGVSAALEAARAGARVLVLD